jgi:hypothetical protein
MRLSRRNATSRTDGLFASELPAKWKMHEQDQIKFFEDMNIVEPESDLNPSFCSNL